MLPFKAACIARYDSVQELVWQGASSNVPTGSTVTNAHPSALRSRDERAGPPPHDAELAAVLHPSTYKCAHASSSLNCAMCPQPDLLLYVLKHCLQGVARP